MASPKSKPMVVTGRNANKGPVFSTPNKLPKKPSCITSVVNPSVASSDNTKPSTAFNGTRIERNTNTSSTNAKSTITPANTGIASLSFSYISMLITLCPEISVLKSYFSLAVLL